MERRVDFLGGAQVWILALFWPPLAVFAFLSAAGEALQTAQPSCPMSKRSGCAATPRRASSAAPALAAISLYASVGIPPPPTSMACMLRNARLVMSSLPEKYFSARTMSYMAYVSVPSINESWKSRGNLSKLSSPRPTRVLSAAMCVSHAITSRYAMSATCASPKGSPRDEAVCSFPKTNSSCPMLSITFFAPMKKMMLYGVPSWVGSTPCSLPP